MLCLVNRLSEVTQLCVSGGRLDDSLGIDVLSNNGGSVLTVLMLTASSRVGIVA